MSDLRKGSLSDWWLVRLSEKMEKHYPDIIGYGTLVDHWKIDGWNDGTVTLFGVYEHEGKFKRCSFPDYGEPGVADVFPRVEHTGWNPARLRRQEGKG